MHGYNYTQTREIKALLDEQPPCTNGCVINTLVGGDHAYCECHCHIGTLPALPPSRERRPWNHATQTPA